MSENYWYCTSKRVVELRSALYRQQIDETPRLPAHHLPPPRSSGRWRLSMERRGNCTSWLQYIRKKIAFMSPEWWKGPTAAEFFFFFFLSSAASPVHRMELKQEVDVLPQTAYLRIKFLSIKPTLIYSGELGNGRSQLLDIFFRLFISHPFSQFFLV